MLISFDRISVAPKRTVSHPPIVNDAPIVSSTTSPNKDALASEAPREIKASIEPEMDTATQEEKMDKRPAAVPKEAVPEVRQPSTARRKKQRPAPISLPSRTDSESMREEYDRRRAVLKALEILQSVSTAIYVPPEHARTKRVGMT